MAERARGGRAHGEQVIARAWEFERFPNSEAGGQGAGTSGRPSADPEKVENLSHQLFNFPLLPAQCFPCCVAARAESRVGVGVQHRLGLRTDSQV